MPQCPVCHEQMIREDQTDFFQAIEAELRKIMLPASKTRWACNNEFSYPNTKAIAKWESTYSQQIKEICKEYGMSAKRKIEKKGFSQNGIKIPPKPPEYRCCPNHYKFTMNDYGGKTKRKRKVFFVQVVGGVAKVKSFF